MPEVLPAIDIESLFPEVTWMPRTCRPEYLNVLVQPRRTFDEIPAFANSVATNGMFYEPLVAVYSSEQAVRYLQEFYRYRNVRYSLEDMVVSLDGRYRFLIAGERRYRAIQYLRASGCTHCRARYGELAGEYCFSTHFPGDEIPVKEATVPFDRAFYIQLVENLHRAVPPAEEAVAVACLFQHQQQCNPDFTKEEFGRLLGRDPDTILGYLRFARLPRSIQDEVATGGIPFGIAVELGRLFDDGGTEDDLWHWVRYVQLHRLNVREFEKLMSSYIAARHEPLSLFEDAGAVDTPDANQQTVGRHLIRYLLQAAGYFRLVKRMFEEGYIGRSEAYSPDSPRHQFHKTLGALNDVAPYICGERTDEKLHRSVLLQLLILAAYASQGKDSPNQGG